MNDIIFAGKTTRQIKDDWQSNKYFAVISAICGGQLTVAEEKISFAKGDALIIPPSTKYSISPTDGHIILLLDRVMLPIKKICTLCGDDGKEIAEECEKAVKFFNGNNNKKQIILSALGGLVTALVTAYYGGNCFSPVVNSIMNDIDKNISNTTYSLEQYMRSLPLNYDYMRKMFKKETGVTPHDYIINARMERAKQIMLSGVTNQYSNYTISQIAEMCGFAEPLYFSRVFKKYYGVSPIDYKWQN